MEKICINCKELKNASEFSLRTQSRDGLQSYCKTCAHTYWQDNRAGHPDQRRNRDRKQHLEALVRRNINVDDLTEQDWALIRSAINRRYSDSRMLRLLKSIRGVL